MIWGKCVLFHLPFFQEEKEGQLEVLKKIIVQENHGLNTNIEIVWFEKSIGKKKKNPFI